MSVHLPLVSVLLPVYNADRYLDEAIASIRQQVYSNWEMVVVDDGSADESQAVITSHMADDGRIRLIAQENRGLVSALNRGLSACRGSLIARMDADDVAFPDRLFRQVRFMIDNPDFVAVGGSAVLIDENGIEIKESKVLVDPVGVHAKLMAGGYALLHPTMMIRSDVLRDVGGYDPAFLCAEDLDLLLRLDSQGAMSNVPEPVLKYRQSSESMSRRLHSRYPYFDWRALSAAQKRGQPVGRRNLAACADRVSWSALRRGDRLEALRFSWRAWVTMPWGPAGYKSFARLWRRNALVVA